MSYTLIATAPLGLESVVAREVHALGYKNTISENGKVIYQTDAIGVARSNLWLRTSDRVMLQVGQFTARTFEELFEQTKALPWPDLLPHDARFPVEGRSVKSQLTSVPACQSIVKKAIVSSLQARYGDDWLPETGAEFAIEVSLLKDVVTLAIDTSGAGLHKRGYRTETGPAPLKETLAAALVLLSRWESHRLFADPMCGTGTIAIEAAMIARNIAPGLRRSFASEGFSFVGAQAFAQAREEAHDTMRTDGQLRVYASDIDPTAVASAKRHAANAGVQDDIALSVTPVKELALADDYGCIIANPPYGERLGDESAVSQLYKEMGQLARRLPTWSIFVLTSHHGFERLFDKKADKKRKLYNGRIECQYYQYLGPLPSRPRIMT